MFYDQTNLGRKSLRAEGRHTGKRRHHHNNRWQAADGEFRCANCRQMVFPSPHMGTRHRNHCPYCLHSLHVDTRPGNRSCTCNARMQPVGLTFKHNGFDKYGVARRGELMLVHFCAGCGEVNLNRIAGDDSSCKILEVFERSLSMDRDRMQAIESAGVGLLTSGNAEEVHIALFGKRALA